MALIFIFKTFHDAKNNLYFPLIVLLFRKFRYFCIETEIHKNEESNMRRFAGCLCYSLSAQVAQTLPIANTDLAR